MKKITSSQQAEITFKLFDLLSLNIELRTLQNQYLAINSPATMDKIKIKIKEIDIVISSLKESTLVNMVILDSIKEDRRLNDILNIEYKYKRDNVAYIESVCRKHYLNEGDAHIYIKMISKKNNIKIDVVHCSDRIIVKYVSKKGNIKRFMFDESFNLIVCTSFINDSITHERTFFNKDVQLVA